MKCLNCGYLNADDAHFCQNCGKPLERACPNCGTHNPGEARFCKNCGYALTGPVEPVQLQAQVPLSRSQAGAATSVRSASHPAGERRVVTSLFADVVGSTGLAEQMDPEDWAAIMNQAFENLTPAITRYEGTVARLMGDALLAFFGAPIAHEDDPYRAALAALDLIQLTREYAAEVRSKYGIDFAIRVGLNTGPVVVGDVGSSQIYEYTAMGDAVNLAARMQTAARPMTALITENTYRYLKPVFDCTDLGMITIKGKNETVHVYELVKPKPDARLVHRVAGLESGFVGRGEEMETLLRLSRAVSAGLGRIAVITGEPGIGKSRLISEWKEKASQEPSHWIEGACLSYGQGIAYHLLVDLLRSILGISAGADLTAAKTALETLCAELFGEKATVFPYLGHLLSITLDPDDQEAVTRLDPQALQSQYLASLRELFKRLAYRQPLVVVLEDIHWADPSSVDLLIHLVPLVHEIPILFCLVTRPDREAPGWKLVTALREQMGASLTEITVRALSEAESSQLVINLLETVDLPDPVRKMVLAKTEGNPLFVEEVIRMLVDRGLLEKSPAGWKMTRPIENVEIPDNLQNLLLARIDRLPEEAKRTLRIAAVIGRQFPVRVLEEVLKQQELSRRQQA